MIEHKKIKGLSFDDILIPPVYSDIRSRNDVDTSTNIGGLQLKIPFIASPMDTVCESNMAIALGKLGGLGIIHRFMSPEEQVEHCNRVADAGCYVVPAIGVGQEERNRFSYLINNCKKIDMISIDVANGHSILMQEMVEFVKSISPDIKIMAGNIATFHAYEFMIGLGVDAVRVGIGGGCLTPHMEVKTKYGYKPISEVGIGEYVLTHTGQWKLVIDTMSSYRAEEIFVINDIETTHDHKYLVVDINSTDSTRDIQSLVYWLEAERVNPEKHNLISIVESEFKEIAITSIKRRHYTGNVYDITVEDDNSFLTKNEVILHNSICKTRIMSSIGIPSLSSVVDCARARHKFTYYHQKSSSPIKLPSIIVDGGVRYPADVVKSIVGGADAIMCGSVFAATEESPGEVIQREDGSLVKMYRGMASASVQKERRGGLKEGTCSEGVTTHLPYKGSIKDVLFGDDGFVGGLKSGMTYLNARTISELQKHDEYIVITGSSLNESHAYGTKK